MPCKNEISMKRQKVKYIQLPAADKNLGLKKTTTYDFF